MRRTPKPTSKALGSPARNLVLILLFMAVVVVAATCAYMAAGWSLADASYMVVLTVYSVGYGEVRPIDTAYLHAVTMTTMAFGCTGMILLTSVLIQFMTELQLREFMGTNRMRQRIDSLTDHVIVCGYGRIGVLLAKELADAKMPLVVLERSPEKLAAAEEAGHACLAGDATTEALLLDAGVQRARALASVLPDDAANVFITLSARSLNGHIDIFARGEAPSTESKLKQAGASRVVLPTQIGAARIARMILFPESASLNASSRVHQLSHNLEDLGLKLELITALEGSTVCGMTVKEAEVRADGAFFVSQIDRGTGETLQRPKPAETILAGDRVLIVTREASAAIRLLFTTREKIRVGRNVI
jgi:voltage-gated potassium channel